MDYAEEVRRLSPFSPSAGTDRERQSRTVRARLWREKGLSGTPEAIARRETLCALIRYRLAPCPPENREIPERTLRFIAAAGEKAPDFSWRLLCRLAEADAQGPEARILRERIRITRERAEAAGCLDRPYPFPDPRTKRAYFAGRTECPGKPFPDDTWGEIILMSGLPGTGKDHWIRENKPDLGMISLDGIRAETGISPAEPQDEVLRIARERATAFLRERRPFVWNATNLTPEVREERIRLFEQYGARVRIVWLETGWDTRAGRNRSRTRDAVVPEEKVSAMLEGMAPPMPGEARTVDWICV